MVSHRQRLPVQPSVSRQLDNILDDALAKQLARGTRIMSRFSSFLLGVFCGAVGLIVTMNYYIVRSKDNVHLVPKVAAKLEIPYYDVRSFSIEDWQKHPSLAAAIVTSKNQSLVSSSGVEAVRGRVEGLLREWTGR